MHTQDTPTTIATQASRYDYSMALVRAMAEHLAAEDDPTVDVPEHVTVYVPHWLEAGEPWSLSREGGRPEWIVSRPGSRHPTTGAVLYGFSMKFGDSLAQVAAAMLAHDQRHPFLVVQEPVFLPVDLAA